MKLKVNLRNVQQIKDVFCLLSFVLRNLQSFEWFSFNVIVPVDF